MLKIQTGQKVVCQLRAKISAEKLAIERPPTVDFTAFELYGRAKNLVLAWNFSTNEKDRRSLSQAADLLNQAVTHDPTFFEAYCQLVWLHDELYHLRLDRYACAPGAGQAAIESALRLRPDGGEAHFARAGHLYRGYLDYQGALAELEIARQTLPNDARLFELKGTSSVAAQAVIQKRRYINLEHAIDLDPRNVLLLQQTALSYEALRRYRDKKQYWTVYWHYSQMT